MYSAFCFSVPYLMNIGPTMSMLKMSGIGAQAAHRSWS